MVSRTPSDTSCLRQLHGSRPSSLSESKIEPNDPNLTTIKYPAVRQRLTATNSDPTVSIPAQIGCGSYIDFVPPHSDSSLYWFTHQQDRHPIAQPS
ncbi:hypothetical protein IG631_02311 [Alternaria alternata]|nr:hypothetical protein IG631_02311 [Alternaria alternata]